MSTNTLQHFIRKQSTRNALWSILGILVFIIFLFPLYWLLISSVKTDMEIFSIPPTLFPREITWEGYTEQIFGKYSILSSAKNSFIKAFSSMALSFVLAVPAAYGVSRFKIPGVRGIIVFFLVTQMLPSSLLLTPLFLTFSRLKLLNTHLAPILSVTTITIPFTLLVLRPMFMTCPREVEEAARIDGCGRFGAFIKIVLPIMKSGLVVVCCFGFVHGWNDLVFSSTFNTKSELYPMTSAIYSLMSEFGIRWNWIMAYATLVVLPPVLIFVLGQKYIISGMVSGSVKG